MGLAESSLSTIYVGKTLTKGVEPTTYQTIKPTGHTIEPGAQSFQGDDIDPSRKPSDTFRSSVGGRGDINAHWRPGDFDSLVEGAMASEFGTAFAFSGTVTFSAPSSGIQTISDDGTTGVLGDLNVGDTVIVAGAVADTENAGLRRVTAVISSDSVEVYNPSGVSAAADAGVTIDHNGTAEIGTTKIYLWSERMFSDGSNLVYSEFYPDMLVGGWTMNFSSAAASRSTFSLQGDPPTLAHADGAAPITKQRGGSDVGLGGDRLVHGMDDVRQVTLYSPTAGAVVLECLMSTLDFGIQNNVRQDSAVGCVGVINTALGPAQATGTANAYVNDVANQTSNIVQFLLDDPDDLEMHIIFGATDATAYGVWFDTVRFQSAPVAVQGNNALLTINGGFSATDMKVTRI